MPDNTLSTLSQIRTKVRRLTRSPSSAQLSNDDIDTYVNTFVLYDFPEHLRLFTLRTTFTFYTNPYQDVYLTDTTISSTNPLYNFKNRYTTVHPPVYMAGVEAFYSQSREQFFGIYPNINCIQSIASTGDGSTTSFSGVVTAQQPLVTNPLVNQNTCLLKNNVLFSSFDSAGNGLAMIDYPISPTIGNLYVPGSAPTSTTVQDTSNYINYVTGAFVVTFTSAPADAAPIDSQTVPLQTGLPTAMLYYDNKFTVRPVPDQPYRVNFEVYVRPTELLEADQQPELSEWWQYIAYGAARKVFQDRMDIESLQMIEPEYKKQEALVLRRTIVQQTNERVATIYTENTAGGTGGSWGFGGGLF